MGACLCPPNDCDISRRGPSAPLFFHPYVKGSQIVMDDSHRVARRVATFRNGLVFSNRPVGVYEKVTLRISKDDGKWHGGLRVGFTWKDPSRLNPQDLPPFACPNLIQQGKTRACLLPDEHCEEGTVVSFWVDARGRVLYNINGEPEQFLLLDGVLMTSPLWAVVDIYGRTRAIQLLESGKQSHNECVICLEHESSAMMLPCSHANFCSDCSLKVLKTSGHCPLCRRKVKKILNFSVF